MINIAHYAQTRYSTKAFDPTKKISEDNIEQLCTLLRYSPSSTNSQPWHFVLASTEAGKQRIANATGTGYTYNQPKILNASHVLVLCAKTQIYETYLETLLAQETQDGRITNEEARKTLHTIRSYYVNKHRFDLKDAQHWMEKQVYLSLGSLLLGAATLNIDACPIEGFDAAVLDETLDLRAQGFSSVVIVALGYRSNDDFNAHLPKSRLPAEHIFTRI
jgi:nitroreductase / dihydropteridine reductase